MKVETLNCPMCGAATSTDAPQCQYCEARLATISCPVCFGMMFIGSKHCQRCGAAADRHEGVNKSAWKCPRCQVEMQSVVIGAESVLECGTCFGLWLDAPSFEKICADREQQAAVLGTPSPAPVTAGSRVKYVPCPECSQLMNRINFAHCSGVIVDLCKKHGIWFDRDELSRIVEFIRSGGLVASRSKEKAALEEELRKLRQEQVSADSGASMLGDSESTRITGIASASGLLKFLLR